MYRRHIWVILKNTEAEEKEALNTEEIKNVIQTFQATFMIDSNGFWRSLVDADIANNAASWQWVSGCGTDSAPYYSIFNPVLQGQKFDPVGDYVRRWIPELRTLPNRWIHEPWRCPAEEASAAGFRLGCDYPYPIIDLGAARTKALQAWQSIRS